MQERKGKVTMKGEPLTLVGEELKVGDMAPDCEVVGKDLAPIKLSSFRGKICVISSLPSLDTSVCDMMTRKFNEEAVALGDDVVVLVVSMDLPFAQDRWCIAADVENVYMLSDYRTTSFGQAFGVLIKDLRLLARAVFVVDKEWTVRYIEIVDELTHEPDYEAVLKVVKDIKK
ncbi:MAG: thiol peroxidase [Planctomycetota bacterium]|jgi:thiol peroxidase